MPYRLIYSLIGWTRLNWLLHSWLVILGIARKAMPFLLSQSLIGWT